MSTFVITIISIIVSSIIALLIAKWQMSRKKIVHFFINSYDIGKGLSLEFPEFRLTFNGEVLSNNVCVIKGGLMNVGVKDIDGLKGNSDITMNLPQGCTVKSIKVLPSNEKLYIQTEFCDNTIDFGINELFVTDEYLEYSAIVENIDNPYDIKFSHRIKDTKKEIENIIIGPDFIKKDSGIWRSIITALFIWGMPIGLCLRRYFEEGRFPYVFNSCVFLILFCFIALCNNYQGKRQTTCFKSSKKSQERIQAQSKVII